MYCYFNVPMYHRASQGFDPLKQGLAPWSQFEADCVQLHLNTNIQILHCWCHCRKRQDCTAAASAGAAENGPNSHRSNISPGIVAGVVAVAVRNKGFRSQRLEQTIAQTHT